MRRPHRPWTMIVVAALLGACAGSPTPSPAPTTAPTPTAAATATPSVGPTALAADPSCEREPALRSLLGLERKDVEFVNRTDFAVQTLWLDYQGARVFYNEVPAGRSYVQPTWLTHPWIVADVDGRCLVLAVTDEDLDQVVVRP